ncbi:archaellin/type IV pilin N-terminal domain-containing protein [Methanolobus sp. ZRKC4]|uniref:archaellin/type IV pilin N-terminal domain-containing protein n=1 Tax=Methanolobus sp. ZRKC4 TaxID=3125787 RepID=UPI00324C3160
MIIDTFFTTIKNNKAQVGIGTLIIFISMVLIAAVAASVLLQTSGTLQQKSQATGKEASKEVSSNLMIEDVVGIRSKNSSLDMSASIDMLEIVLTLNTASAPVNLEQVILSITDGSTTNDLVYAGNTRSKAPEFGIDASMSGFGSVAVTNRQLLATGNTTLAASSGNVTLVNSRSYFTVDKIRDEDSSFQQSNPTMTTGDYVIIYASTASLSTVSTGYTTLKDANVSSSLKSTGLNILPRSPLIIVLTPEAGASATVNIIMPSTYGAQEMMQLFP